MKIYFIRHGKSEANVDKRELLHRPDNTMNLVPLGEYQAKLAGEYLRDEEMRLDRKYRLWVSPYERTRQTAKIVYEHIKDYNVDVRESIHLVEQQFGIYDGYLDEELPQVFPMEHEFYKKHENHQSRFWARYPQGESRFDVCLRVHQFLGSIMRDYEKHSINNLIVISHGVTIRAFIMTYLHLSYNWFEEEPNPKNCSIRLIEDKLDKGYIFIPPGK